MDKRTATQEYLEGAKSLKPWAVELLKLVIETFIVGVGFALLALAILGIANLMFSDVRLLTTPLQRLSAGLAILFWVVVFLVGHVQKMRHKGRQVFDQNQHD